MGFLPHQILAELVDRIGLGSKTISPSCGSLEVDVFKEGIASALGHDLTLEARRWSGVVTIHPVEELVARVEVQVDAGSLQVKSPAALSDSDRSEILQNIERKVLVTAHHPEIRFRSMGIAPAAPGGGPGSFRLRGELALAGKSRPVELLARCRPTPEELQLEGLLELFQSDFGIRPFRGPLGVLRVKDAVRIRWNVVLPIPHLP
jgi:polyisoprenoid-binding protein YceI